MLPVMGALFCLLRANQCLLPQDLFPKSQGFLSAFVGDEVLTTSEKMPKWSLLSVWLFSFLCSELKPESFLIPQ